MTDTKPARQPVELFLIGVALAVVLAGHLAGLWQVPQLRASPGVLAPINPRSITVAYSHVNTNGVTPWRTEDTEEVMLRLVRRWPEATLGRSELRVLPETEIRDVLIVFNDNRSATAAARFVPFAGGRLRWIEVYPQNLLFGRIDIDYLTETLLHELGHSLGCCTGPGTSGGHFVGPACVRILCQPHGTARTFTEEELGQMGLGR